MASNELEAAALKLGDLSYVERVEESTAPIKDCRSKLSGLLYATITSQWHKCLAPDAWYNIYNDDLNVRWRSLHHHLSIESNMSVIPPPMAIHKTAPKTERAYPPEIPTDQDRTGSADSLAAVDFMKAVTSDIIAASHWALCVLDTLGTHDPSHVDELTSWYDELSSAVTKAGQLAQAAGALVPSDMCSSDPNDGCCRAHDAMSNLIAAVKDARSVHRSARFDLRWYQTLALTSTEDAVHYMSPLFDTTPGPSAYPGLVSSANIVMLPFREIDIRSGLSAKGIEQILQESGRHTKTRPIALKQMRKWANWYT